MSQAWQDALLVLSLFAVDPAGTGVVLRGGPGPVRDHWLEALAAVLPAAMRRMPAAIEPGRLLGGLDLPATLQAGRPVSQPGLLAESDGGVVIAAMAERLPALTAAALGAVLDDGTVVGRDGTPARCRIGVVALDEGVEEALAPGLADRLAFVLELDGIGWRDAATQPAAAAIAAARAGFADIAVEDGVVEALCGTALALGVESARAGVLALRVARAAAALDGRLGAGLGDAAVAARLVLAPRATRIPAEEAPEPDDAPAETPDPADDGHGEAQGRPGDDIVLEAAKAAIPPALLARLQDQGRDRRAGRDGRAGAKTAGGRGRPVGLRAGMPGPRLRLNLIETLRAAAPWQRLRGAPPGRVTIRRDDVRVTRHEQRRRTTTIFVVDASGSSALNRLAEAKGAVELLLADCYRRRDQVAVVAFRGRTATLLLPPTRSLVRAKRGLAGLPGGGGTPLAAGIGAGTLLAEAARRAGDTPALVLLTDGRGNITLGGEGRRAEAERDSLAAARALRGARISALLLDISRWPSEEARRLAAAMGALYVPLPQADAAAVARAVRAARA